MIKKQYKTKGICAKQINISLSQDKTIDKVEFMGGCSGNAQGMSSLLVGMKATDAIEKLSGTDCMGRGTSCPDQLATALTQILNS